MGGVFCPALDCGNGMLPDQGQRRIECTVCKVILDVILLMRVISILSSDFMVLSHIKMLSLFMSSLMCYHNIARVLCSMYEPLSQWTV